MYYIAGTYACLYDLVSLYILPANFNGDALPWQATMHHHAQLPTHPTDGVLPGRAIQTAMAVFGEQPSCRTVLTPLHSERRLGMKMVRMKGWRR